MLFRVAAHSQQQEKREKRQASSAQTLAAGPRLATTHACSVYNVEVTSAASVTV